MRYYFWNSISHLGGYKAVELIDGKTVEAKLPSEVDAELSNGGCQTMLASTRDGKWAFLILKGLKHDDTNRTFDSQGRTVNINLILMDQQEHKPELFRIMLYILENWNSFESSIGKTIFKSDSELGYYIDQDKYKELLASNNQYTFGQCNILKDIESANPSRPIIILSKDASPDYYSNMTNLLYKAYGIKTRISDYIQFFNYSIIEKCKELGNNCELPAAHESVHAQTKTDEDNVDVDQPERVENKKNTEIMPVNVDEAKVESETDGNGEADAAPDPTLITKAKLIYLKVPVRIRSFLWGFLTALILSMIFAK